MGAQGGAGDPRQGGAFLRTDWIAKDEMDLALRLLTPENRLVMETCLATGLRVGDVLELRSDKLRSRVTIREAKTGKTRRVGIPASLLRRLQAQAGSRYVFEGARSKDAHRTRQAVWKDLKRAARAARIPANVGPHSARKVYAVDLYRRKGAAATQAALNHDDQAVTLLYALADKLRSSAPSRRRSAKVDKGGE